MTRVEVLGEELDVQVERHRITSSEPGPTVSVFGGVHGDELEGVLATSMLLDRIGPIRCGEVRLVPRANPSAVDVGSRESADGGNLARCFPGDPSGTYTERVAHVLTDQVIRGSDALIDLHSGGRNYAMPLFAGYIGGLQTSEGAAAMATEFAAPVSWRHDVWVSGRSISTAADVGVPAIYVEGGRGGGSLDHAEIQSYVAGVERVLASLGVIDPSRASPGPVERRFIPGGDGNSDASLITSHTGYCLSAVGPGDVVETAQLIAEICDADGRLVETIEAPRDGIVMMIRAVAAVVAGDGIVMLAPAAR